MICAKSYNPQQDINKTEIEERIVLEDMDNTDPEYYEDAFNLIKSKNDYLNAYLMYFERVNLTQDSREKLNTVYEDLQACHEDISEAVEFYNDTCLAGGNSKTAAKALYEEDLQEIQEKLDYQDTLIDEIVSGKYSDEYKVQKQNEIANVKAELNEEKQLAEEKIAELETMSSSQLAANNGEADVILQKNAEALNNVITEFNTVLAEIAETENYEIIYNKRLLEKYEAAAGLNGQMNESDIMNDKKGQAIIYAKSIQGLDVKQERFFAAFTFFILFGVVISVLTGAFYRKKEK